MLYVSRGFQPFSLLNIFGTSCSLGIGDSGVRAQRMQMLPNCGQMGEGLLWCIASGIILWKDWFPLPKVSVVPLFGDDYEVFIITGVITRVQPRIYEPVM